MLSLGSVAAGDFEPMADLRAEALRESLERLGRFDPVRVRERLRSAFDMCLGGFGRGVGFSGVDGAVHPRKFPGEKFRLIDSGRPGRCRWLLRHGLCAMTRPLRITNRRAARRRMASNGLSA